MTVFLDLYRKTQQLRRSEQREATQRQEREALEQERRFVAELSEREQDVLYDYVNDVPSEETGAALGISGGRVRQVWKQIFTKLRNKL